MAVFTALTRENGRPGENFCDFFEFFSKVATQQGDVLDITPIEELCFFLEKLKTGATKVGCNLDSQW